MNYVEVGKREPEGDYCLVIPSRHLIIAHGSFGVMQIVADQINADFGFHKRDMSDDQPTA